MYTCMHAVNFCKLTFEHYIFLEHSPNFKRIVIYRRRESTLVAFSKNWLTSIFCLKTAYFLNCGVDVSVHVSQDELCTAGKLRAAKGEASRVWRFLSTLLFTARGLSLCRTIFILASLRMCCLG